MTLSAWRGLPQSLFRKVNIVADEVEVKPVQTLAAKLAEAMNEVGGVEKKGRNQAQNYDYVKAADVAKALRYELFKRGIVIIPNELECIAKQIEFTNAKGEKRQSNEVQIKTAYHITDGTETLVMHGIGIAWDSGDKAIYKAKTGSLKYFLRGLGLVPDERDDPEFDNAPLVDKKAERTFKKGFEKKTADQARNITPAEAKVFWDAVKNNGKTEEQVKARFRILKIAETKEMHYSDYEAELKWAASEVLPPVHNFAKLFAKAKAKKIPENDVKRIGHEIYKVDSLNALTAVQFEGLMEWVDNQESA
jgi:hypothetical protein